MKKKRTKEMGFNGIEKKKRKTRLTVFYFWKTCSINKNCYFRKEKRTEKNMEKRRK